MNNAMAVFIGGGLGSLARYFVSEFLKKYFTNQFPLATLISNLTSCIIFALFIYFFYDRFSHKDGLFFLILVGFCGGFSTFSTFSFETFQLIKQAQYAMAFLNIFVSIVFCLMIFIMVKSKI
jgi:fluoride exporter